MTAILIILFVVNCINKLPFEKLTSGSLCVGYYHIATELRRYCYNESINAKCCYLLVERFTACVASFGWADKQ